MSEELPRWQRVLRAWGFLTRKRTRRELGTVQDWKMRLVFWAGALLVGVLVVLFARAAQWSYGQFQRLYEWSEYAPLIVTPLGMVLIAWIMRRFAPAARGSGIPQVLVILKPRYRWLRPAFLGIRVIVAKFVLTCMGLMVGASIGREGPSVHIGAAVMRDMGRLGQLRQKAVDNALIVGGGAAGVSAAFNAPLAGIVFAVESLAQPLEKRNSGILIVSIFLSGVVVLALSGHYSYFGTPEATLMLADSWPGVLVTGLSCGLLGGLFARVLVSGTRALVPTMQAEPLKLVFLCGLFIASLGVLTGGETFGTGYEQVRDLLDAQREGEWTFPLAKMAATLASYFSGIPGGIFSPSMAAGAGVGAAVSEVMPGGALAGLAMVGMASFLSGVLQRPLVSFVIVMEMTGNRHDILLALMLGSLVAFMVSRLLMRASLYDALAEDLVSGQADPGTRPVTQQRRSDTDSGRAL